MRQHVGVAISGGGHRATAWGLGVLLYLVDSGKHREVAAVSSVSGGSIVNGVVAHEVDLPRTDAPSFDAGTAPLVRHVSSTGLFFWGPSTNAYVVSVLAGATVGALALLTGLAMLAADGLSWRSGGALASSVVVLALVARWFERRSDVVDGALARTHFSRDGRPTRLSQVQRSVDHVFCATDLQSAQHVYLAPGFLYSYLLGRGTPGDMRLSTAVQASACLPGAFSPRRLPLAPLEFSGGALAPPPAEAVLVDGGVYDNMADQWLEGLAVRTRRSPELPVVARDVDEVVVVNASSPVPWSSLRRSRAVLLGELMTLSRVSSVMYQVTTERRRHSLVRAWDDAEVSGRGQRGALVHIAQSPYTVADTYRDSASWPGRARRAEAVLALLGDDAASRTVWQTRAAASRRVPTVLRKLGPESTLDLLEHAYVLAMCNLHVLLGYPLAELPPRERFTRLLTG